MACNFGCVAEASHGGRCLQFGVAANIEGGKGTPQPVPEGKAGPVPSSPNGKFEIVGNTGVAAQHIALVTPTKMLIIDKAEANPPKLPDGSSAYNAEYDLTTNTYRVLEVQTNTFCSGGGFLPNGTLISAGGAETRVSFKLCSPSRRYTAFHLFERAPELNRFFCIVLALSYVPYRVWLPIFAHVEPLRR